ncbi:MAG TPA: hypothetical protein VG013_09280, partial [Gemmataceae bacterium]|nr:hypothetical protein [Gemmataceae bacterium]
MRLARWLKEVRYLLEYLFFWPIVAAIRGLSEARSQALAIGLSRVLYRLLTFERQWCRKNLQLAFGDRLTASQRTRLAMKAFENNLRTIMEAVRWTPEWMATHVTEEGANQLRAVIREYAKQGKGFILVSAHLGNFELLPAFGHLLGEKCTVVYRPQANWRLNRLVAGARVHYMPQTVQSGPWTLLKFRHLLCQGEGVGL